MEKLGLVHKHAAQRTLHIHVSLVPMTYPPAHVVDRSRCSARIVLISLRHLSKKHPVTDSNRSSFSKHAYQYSIISNQPIIQEVMISPR